MTAQCRKTTIKGGRGVDDASGISTWRCVLDAEHEGDCRYLQFVRNGLEVRS